MEKKCSYRVLYKELPNVVVLRGDLFEITNYESFVSKIIEKSTKNNYKNIRVSKGDKFMLEIENYNVVGLNSVWNDDTFNYFLSKAKNDLPEKLKLIIVKINEYPKWNPPQYFNILKKKLKSTWDLTKGEIQNELTENYLNEGKRLFIQEKKEMNDELRKQLYKEMHVDIICNNCLSSNFKGERYICSECNNFNLCYYCKEKSMLIHNQDHFFIKLNYPIIIDIRKYNSIFCPNKILLRKKKEPFETKINIINSGQQNLLACFFSQIRFGKNYLGCMKTTITNDCNKGDKTELDVLMKFEDEEEEEEENSEEQYDGYFRLMTKEGIPFGDILYIKLIIEN